MKSLFPRLWAATVAIAFGLLWALGMNAAPLHGDALWPRLVGIWGWGLVGLGFLGVVLAVRLASRPKKPRRLVPIACPQKAPETAKIPLHPTATPPLPPQRGQALTSFFR